MGEIDKKRVGQRLPAQPPLITLSSDFGPGGIGCGAMEAVIYQIYPAARVVHWCHTIPGYDIKDGARQLEGVAQISPADGPRLPPGIHVCVVDPGVGTQRRGIVLQAGRGDFLIGPDNGVLLPAAARMGGTAAAFELTHSKYQRHPVSSIFHGRDVFAPAAAYLASGMAPENFGPRIDPKSLAPAPFAEARWQGNQLQCEVLHINENGSLFLNVLAEEFGKRVQVGDKLELNIPVSTRHLLVIGRTFGDVPPGQPLILNDDFGRVEVAIHRGNFAFTFGVKRGEKLILRKEEP